jgi:acyl-CoA dehydrogenase
VRRTLFTEEHEAFRKVVTTFFEREAVPHMQDWENAGMVDRTFLQKAGELGLMGFQVPLKYGGAGLDTFTYNVIVSEVAAALHFVPITMRVHTDIVLPYFLRYADDSQRDRWLPKLAVGESICAIAMSEPGIGSDLAGIQTRAVRDGDQYILNGSKTFITTGLLADLIIVVARTSEGESRRNGLSLLVVEGDMPGFVRGRNLEKLGLKYSDTAELFFEDVAVPVANQLGEEGQAFDYLASNLPQERTSISVGAVSMSAAALEMTLEYTKQRLVFGKPLASMQNTKFVLAEVATEIEAAQQMLDRAIVELDNNTLTGADAAKLKLFCTEVQARSVDRCLQLFGGYGYMRDYDISRMYADARVTRIYGGTSEVMKVIIARSMGL